MKLLISKSLEQVRTLLNIEEYQRFLRIVGDDEIYNVSNVTDLKERLTASSFDKFVAAVRYTYGLPPQAKGDPTKCPYLPPLGLMCQTFGLNCIYLPLGCAI